MSNDSTNSSKHVSKLSFFRDIKEITNDNVRKENTQKRIESKNDCCRKKDLHGFSKNFAQTF